MSEKDTQRKQTFISHRLLSWCGDHKMKVIAIAILLALASLSGGYWYHTQQVECSGFELKLSWDTTKGGTNITTATKDVEVEINSAQEAILVIETKTPKEGTLRVTADSRDTAIELYIEGNITKEAPPCIVREVYILKGENRIGTIRLKAPESSQKYGVIICATLDNQCETCKGAYFKVLPAPTPPPSPTPCPIQKFINWVKNLCAGTFVLFAIVPFWAVVRRNH